MASPSGNPSTGVGIDTEAEPHLRVVLEAQPAVVARIGKDGTFLAINGAGLSLVGATSLEQLLGRSLCDLIPKSERSTCTVFLERVTTGHRGSLEIELTGLTGLPHTVELHASPYPGAPDGIPSVLATFRDITESRRLEQSLVEAMERQSAQEAAHEAERAKLQAELDELRMLLDGQVSEGSGRIEALQQQLAEAAARHEETVQQYVAEIASLRDEVSRQNETVQRQAAEIAGLTEALDEQGRIVGEQAARLAELGAAEARVAELRQEADELARKYDEDAGALRNALNEAMAEQARLAESLIAEEGRAAADAERIAELQRRLAELEGAAASAASEAEERLAAAARTYEEQLAELRVRTEALAGEQADRIAQLERALTEAEEACRRLGEELQRQLRDAEDAHQARVAELESAMRAAEEAAQARLDEERRMAAEAHHARVSELEAALAAAAADAEARLGDLQAQLGALEESSRGRIVELESALTSIQQERDARIAELELALAAATQKEREQVEALQSRIGILQAEVEALAAAYKKADAALLEERNAFEAQLAAAAEAKRELEAAVASAAAGRATLEERLRRFGATLADLAREAGEALASAPAPDIAPPQTAGALARQLEPRLRSAFGDQIPLTVLVANPDSAIAAPAEAVERALAEFAADRASALKGGQATIEVADVEIDDAVAAARQVPSGSYVLWATHLSGKGSDRHLPRELFDTANTTAWQDVSVDLQSSLDVLTLAGGHAWLAREGNQGIVLELYLPRGRAASEIR